MRLAIYQGAGVPLHIENNLKLIEKLAQQSASEGARLLVLPELFLTGYNIGDAIAHLAEPLSGQSIQTIAQIAQTYRISLIVGLPEREGDRCYNAAVWVDAKGQVIGSYRKTHLFGDIERRLFTPGDRWLIHTLDDLTIGILICFDVEFPEAARALAQQGVDLIVVPTANMYPYVLIPELVVPTRALENQIYVAYVNRIGTEDDLTYCGTSRVVAPNGKAIAHAGLDEVLLICDINKDAIVQERQVYDYLKERRTDLFNSLSQA